MQVIDEAVFQDRIQMYKLNSNHYVMHADIGLYIGAAVAYGVWRVSSTALVEAVIPSTGHAHTELGWPVTKCLGLMAARYSRTAYSVSRASRPTVQCMPTPVS